MANRQFYNPVFESAIQLINQGLSVIPLKYKGKTPSIPSWLPFMSERPTEAHMTNWFVVNFETPQNIAIVCGPVSGIVVVDVDYPDQCSVDFPLTPTVKSNRGYHYYFKHPGFDIGNAKLPFGDLQSTNKYVVAPPSVHESGHKYEWLIPFSRELLADLPSEIIELAYSPEEAQLPELPYDTDTTAYGHSWFADCRLLARHTKGDRNIELNKVACKAGSLIAAGELNEDEAIEAMIDASKRSGLVGDDGLPSVRATIRSGLKAGKKNPRYPSELESPALDLPRAGKLTFRKASEVKPEKIDWLWPGVLPKNALSILAGNPGLGKSQVALSIAATITSGGRWPVTGERAATGSVIILSGEDSVEHTIVPRLVAAGADLDRVIILDMVAADDGGERQFNLQEDIPKLREVVEELGDVSLIVIDVLNAYLNKADTNNSGDVRRITNDLARLASSYDLCVVGLTHLNKGDGKQATYRVQGSISWVGAARTAFLVEKDEDGGRVMSPIKNNLAKDNLSFPFDVLSRELPGGIETSVVSWGSDSQTKTADQTLVDKADGPAIRAAKEFLTTILSDGSMPQVSILEKSRAVGISQSTLYRAKENLNIVSIKVGDNTNWHLPPEPTILN